MPFTANSEPVNPDEPVDEPVVDEPDKKKPKPDHPHGK